VRDVRALTVEAAPQRVAEGWDPLEQVGVALLIVRVDRRSGVDMLDPHATMELGHVGQVRLVLLRVHGHPVTMAGEHASELGQSDVIAVRAGAGARTQRRRILGYQGDLHGVLSLADEPQPRCCRERRKMAPDPHAPRNTAR
jgi:hypothetical protein